MQKLTILILITLILSSLLYAEDETIILDRDILYWKPAGPDLLIPDSYISFEILQYPEGAFRSSLFFPLNRSPKTIAQDNEKVFSEQVLLINWTPPSLSTIEEETRNHSITAFSSYPYGSGVLLKGGENIFHYELGANYAHGEDHPHWLATGIAVNGTQHNLDTRFAWRSKENPSLLSVIKWDMASSPLKKSELYAGFDFQSLFPLEETAEIDSLHQWKASADFGAEFKIPLFNTEISMEGEYRESVADSYWRITPELLLNKKYKGKRGDWNLNAGILADIYTGEQSQQYFPQLHIEYMNYGNWSFFLNSESDELDDSLVHHFLTEEVYRSPKTAFYRYHKFGTGFYITENHFQLNMGAGYISGNFPEIENKALISNGISLFFIDSSISWNYNAGKVTELNCYADYQDRGSLRFSLESRWLWSKTEEKSSFGFLLRAGNRELLRGYRYFFDDSSDLMTGVGIEIEFLKPLQTAVYMDYLPLNNSIEGCIELSWAY
jgi:hypothetical protein